MQPIFHTEVIGCQQSEEWCSVFSFQFSAVSECRDREVAPTSDHANEVKARQKMEDGMTLRKVQAAFRPAKFFMFSEGCYL